MGRQILRVSYGHEKCYHAHGWFDVAKARSAYTRVRAGNDFEARASKRYDRGGAQHVLFRRSLFSVCAQHSAAYSINMSMSTLSIPRIIDVGDVLMRNFTLDTAKNCFLGYLFARRALKLWRRVRARGLFQSFRDVYAFIAQVFISFT